MKCVKSVFIFLLLIELTPIITAQDQPPVRVVCIAELSGPGTLAGTSFKNGMELAFKEINASGGILNRKIIVNTFDTQTVPALAKALARRANQLGAYVVIGPVYSGSTIVSMVETQNAGIPNFTASEASNITAQSNPYIFRTSYNQSAAMPKLATYIQQNLKAKSVAIVWVENPFGQGGRDAMVKELAQRGIKVVADITIDPAKAKMYSTVVRVKAANPDVLFVYLNEEQSIMFLKELKKEGFDKPVLGETTLINQKVIDEAGDAADGIRGHVGLTTYAPNANIKAFAEKFEKQYNVKADHNAMKGYIGAYVIKAVTEKIGKFDRAAFARAMKGVRLSSAEHPGVLLDVRYDDHGDIDRESYIVEVAGRKAKVVATLPPLTEF